MTYKEYEKKYKTREERIKALNEMSDEELEELIETTENITGKIAFSKYLKHRA